MRWNDQGGGLGPDIEDRRGEGGGGGFNFGGGGMRLGCGGLILLGVLSLIFKQNFFALLAPQGGGSPQASVDSRPVAPPSAPHAGARARGGGYCAGTPRGKPISAPQSRAGSAARRLRESATTEHVYSRAQVVAHEPQQAA